MAEEVKDNAELAENVQQEVPAADENTNGAAADETTTEEVVAEEVAKSKYADLKTGMVVRVHLKIKETTPKGEERERIQVFEGTIIAVKGDRPAHRTINVRKVSKGFGVERIFPIEMPGIDRIEVVKRYKVTRSKIYFIRESKRKLKEVKK